MLDSEDGHPIASSSNFSSSVNLTLEQDQTTPLATAQIEGIRLPRILLAGVQKSGSTALSDFIHRAGACLSRPDPMNEKEKKEVHFFDNEQLYSNGIRFYSKLFAHCDNMKLAVDATPNTFKFPHRVKEVYQLAGKTVLEELKIIIVVREPVARELSLYNHLAVECRGTISDSCFARRIIFKHNSNGTYLRSFHEYADYLFSDNAIAQIPALKQSRPTGMYGDHFEQWLHYFDRKQILILSYDELKQDEPSFLQRVVSFLNLDVGTKIIKSGTKPKNTKMSSSKIDLPPCDVQDQLSKMFLSSNDIFFKMIDTGDNGPWMEQRPFPRFELSNCTANIEESSLNWNKAVNHKAPPFPKILWMFWEQGLEHLESIARDPRSKYTVDVQCVKAMMKLNSNWDVRFLSENDGKELAPLFSSLLENKTLYPLLQPRLKSDFLRLELLSRFGVSDFHF